MVDNDDIKADDNDLEIDIKHDSLNAEKIQTEENKKKSVAMPTLSADDDGMGPNPALSAQGDEDDPSAEVDKEKEPSKIYKADEEEFNAMRHWDSISEWMRMLFDVLGNSGGLSDSLKRIGLITYNLAVKPIKDGVIDGYKVAKFAYHSIGEDAGLLKKGLAVAAAAVTGVVTGGLSTAAHVVGDVDINKAIDTYKTNQANGMNGILAGIVIAAETIKQLSPAKGLVDKIWTNPTEIITNKKTKMSLDKDGNEVISSPDLFAYKGAGTKELKDQRNEQNAGLGNFLKEIGLTAYNLAVKPIKNGIMNNAKAFVFPHHQKTKKQEEKQLEKGEKLTSKQPIQGSSFNNDENLSKAPKTQEKATREANLEVVISPKFERSLEGMASILNEVSNNGDLLEQKNNIAPESTQLFNMLKTQSYDNYRSNYQKTLSSNFPSKPTPEPSAKSEEKNNSKKSLGI